jgi:hypothetical protein
MPILTFAYSARKVSISRIPGYCDGSYDTDLASRVLSEGHECAAHGRHAGLRCLNRQEGVELSRPADVR